MFTKSEYTVKENVGIVHVTISRTGSSFLGVSVYWKTVEGSAKRGTDFGDTGGILYFASGETSKTIAIHILDDKVTTFNYIFVHNVQVNIVRRLSMLTEINFIINRTDAAL